MNLPDFLTQDELGFITVTGHRIGLNHIVRLYRDGYSVEQIAEEFDTLALATIHKVIAYYLENQALVNRYMAENDAELERQAAQATKGPTLAELRKRLETKQRARAS
jgi:uncharacterized protein (DUF433 family)